MGLPETTVELKSLYKPGGEGVCPDFVKEFYEARARKALGFNRAIPCPADGDMASAKLETNTSQLYWSKIPNYTSTMNHEFVQLLESKCASAYYLWLLYRGEDKGLFRFFDRLMVEYHSGSFRANGIVDEIRCCMGAKKMPKPLHGEFSFFMQSSKWNTPICHIADESQREEEERALLNRLHMQVEMCDPELSIE